MTEGQRIVDEAWASFDRWRVTQPDEIQDLCLVKQAELYYEAMVSLLEETIKSAPADTTAAERSARAASHQAGAA